MYADIQKTANHRAEHEENHAPEVKRHSLPDFRIEYWFKHCGKSSSSEAKKPLVVAAEVTRL